MKTVHQMFGKAVRDLTAMERAQREDELERQRRADEAEARLDEPVTRRELLEALEAASSKYAGSGFDEQDRIADAFAALHDLLK